MRKLLSFPREFWSILCELPSVVHQMRWFLGFAVVIFVLWISAWFAALGDALTGLMLIALLSFYGLAVLKAAADLFPELADTSVARTARVLVNGAGTSAAFFYVFETSVSDFESAAALWGFLIGQGLLAHATDAWSDYDLGGIIRVRAAPLYWVGCVMGFVLAFKLNPPISGEGLQWCAAMTVLTVGLWTLPYPQWLKALIERFRWSHD